VYHHGLDVDIGLPPSGVSTCPNTGIMLDPWRRFMQT
jgi:hypothetical protein